MQRLLLLILPTTFALLSLPRKPKDTRTDPPYTCDSILGSSLCPLEEEHKTLEVRGTTLHYWVYQVPILMNYDEQAKVKRAKNILDT